MDIDPAAAEPACSVALRPYAPSGIALRRFRHAEVFPEKVFRSRTRALQRAGFIACRFVPSIRDVKLK